MIILEGCDCTGKTTLASRLSERFVAPITHYSEHNEDIFTAHAIQCKPGTREIADRFHMSEIPYTMYYRHSIPMYESVKDIDLILRDRKCLQIICTPPWLFVKNCWEKRKEEELIQSLEALHGIYMWYRDKSQAFTSLTLWKYDYTVESVESLCEKINEWEQENGE